MEKLTITRIGQEKTIDFTNKKTGQPDSFKKVGFLTNEHGEKWFDLTFRGECPVKVGQSYEFEVSEREYNGKTYHDAKLPKSFAPRGGGMSLEQVQGIMRELHAINANVLRVWEQVRPDKGLTSAGQKVPDFSEVDERMAEIQEAKAARDNADEQFGDPWGGMEVRESD